MKKSRNYQRRTTKGILYLLSRLPDSRVTSWSLVIILLLFAEDLTLTEAQAGIWTFDTIESGVSSEARNSSIAIDSSGMIHVLYYDEPSSGQYQLKYAKQTVNGWDTQVVDQAKGDQTVIRLDSNDRPHIAYNHVVGQQQVRYGLLDSGSWALEDVHQSAIKGRIPSLVLDSSGNPHIGFTDNGGVGWASYYAMPGSPNWVNESVGSQSFFGNFGSKAIGLDDNDTPYLFGSSGGGFQLATRSSFSSWSIETGLGPEITNVSVVFGNDGMFHVSATIPNVDDLVYLTGNGASWSSTIVDSPGPAGLANTSIALGPNGLPRITYETDFGGGGITKFKHAYYNGSTWETEFIPDELGAQSGTSLAIDENGYSHVVYWNLDGELVHAKTLVVPEPSSLVLACLGMVGLLAVVGKRNGWWKRGGQ